MPLNKAFPSDQAFLVERLLSPRGSPNTPTPYFEGGLSKKEEAGAVTGGRLGPRVLLR